MSAILSKQRAKHFIDQGFVMNHSSTKSLVECLHAYLNFLTKFLPKIDIQDNKAALEFVCETLGNPLTQRDILTQSSIIFWMMLKISLKDKEYDLFELLLTCLEGGELIELFGGQKKLPEKLKLNRGIL